MFRFVPFQLQWDPYGSPVFLASPLWFQGSGVLPRKGETTVLASLPAFHNWSQRTTLGLADGLLEAKCTEAPASFRFNPSPGRTLQRRSTWEKKNCLVKLVSLWVSDDRHLG